MVTVHGEPMHVRVQGEGDGPVAVLLSGWSTAVPSVDFLTHQGSAHGG